MLCGINRSFGSYISVASDFGGPLQSSPKQQNATEANQNSEARYYEHPQRPRRHFVLSYHISLGAIMLVGGFYYFAYAFRFESWRKPETALPYLFLGVGGVACGLLLLLLALRAYLFP